MIERHLIVASTAITATTSWLVIGKCADCMDLHVDVDQSYNGHLNDVI